MVSRRALLASGTSAIASCLVSAQAPSFAEFEPHLELFDAPNDQSQDQLARNEGYWERVRSQYSLDPKFVWLANGPGGNAPRQLLDRAKAYLEETATNASYALPEFASILESGSSAQLRARMAKTFGCDDDEIALQRNTMEGTATCVYGLPLRRDDEVLSSVLDYDACLSLWRLREKRDGIRLRLVDVPTPAGDDDIIAAFASAITPRTRVMMVCHMTTNNGQIFPVRRLGELARQHGIFFLVDGAHGPGQLTFHLHELNCDAYAASLHKWFNAPRAAGLLYVRRSRIAEIAPLFPDASLSQTTAEKFEYCGTVQYATPAVLPLAFDIYDRTGITNREARLRYLRDYWMAPLAKEERIQFFTSADPRLSCAIASFRVKGIEPSKLKKMLRERYGLRIKSIEEPEVKGLIANNVAASFTNSIGDLDRLLESLTSILRST